jgi:uncharacterized protein YjbJ (UPF0337 family)
MMSSAGKKAAGGIEYIRGKLLRAWGKITGNRSMQAKGGARYEVGKAQRKADDLKR